MAFLFNHQLIKSYQSKTVVKVIAGLDNGSIKNIMKLVKAAEISKATYIDIIANPKIVSIIKSLTNLPICVSSIDPLELYNSVIAGADIVELGNFDLFYTKNIYFTLEQIYNLALETRLLLPSIDLCVTIPHIFSLESQVQLAIQLEKIGVNILQTEGFSTSVNNIYNINNNLDYLALSASKASSSLSSTYALSQSVNIPIITASGINSISSSVAISYGSSGIGIGSSLKKYQSIADMSLNMIEILQSLKYQNSYSSMNTKNLCFNSLYELSFNKEKTLL